MKTPSAMFAVLVLTLIVVIAAQPNAQNTVASRERILLDYTGTGKAKPFVLALDELGVVVSAKDPTANLQALQKRMNGAVAKQHEGGVYVFKLRAAMPRRSLFELAYKLEEERLVTNAGVAVYPENAQTPLFATNSMIVQFARGTTREQALALFAREGLTLVSENPYSKGLQFLVRVKPSEGRDSIALSARVAAVRGVAFAHPDFVRIIDYRQFTPNDPLFANQWHHNNPGTSGGTVDADGDTDFAWTITRGAAATRIAILDSGFDVAHEDLQPNRWTNAGETGGDGDDDDANGCIDDVNVCAFTAPIACAPGSLLTCGTGAVTAANHGTSVAGVAAGRGHNMLGVSGACPNCTIIQIQQGGTFFNDGLAIGYAGATGADVFTNSWGYSVGTAVPANVATAIANTAAAGTVIFWAMNNGNRNDCTGTPDISADPNAIAISASSNQDRKVTESAFGNCMELLSPTHRGYGGAIPFSGTLHVTTTDRTGAAGYNNTAPVAACPGEIVGQNYTSCFGGTSSATPYAAGIGGLMLSATPALTRQQVQRALQDTADKIQDSTGAYSQVTGFSTPGGGVATHGFGRVNAFEAVRLVAPTASGGRAGVDIFIRDNRLDWGNTEQPSNVLMEPTRGFIPHYESVDIKVDAGPTYQPAPTTSAQFEALIDESPISGQVNKVFVRVRNRGATTAASVTVKLQWAFAGTALPSLPAGYWAAFPADPAGASSWTTLGTLPVANLQYSGASVAGGAGDAAQILSYDFTGPPIDPAIPAFRHHCLLAVISSPQDPVSAVSMTRLAPDAITPGDNNVTHKNVAVQDPLPGDGRFGAAFYVRNPFDREIETRLAVMAPKGWRVQLKGAELGKPFRLKPRAENLVFVEISGPGGAVGRVEIRQSHSSRQQLPKGQLREQVLGGVVYEFRAKGRYQPPKLQKEPPKEGPVIKRGD